MIYLKMRCGHKITLEEYLNLHMHNIGPTTFPYIRCESCRENHFMFWLIDDSSVAADEVIKSDSGGE